MRLNSTGNWSLPRISTPPWTLITAVLQKLRDDRVRGMMVVPERPTAAWWPLFESLCVKARRFSTPIYMSENGTLVQATLLLLLDASSAIALSHHHLCIFTSTARSLGFLPRKRCSRIRGRIGKFPRDDPTQAPHLTAFMCYKDGMTHVVRDLDKPGSKMHKKEIIQVCVQMPSFRIGYAIRGHR